MMNTLRFTMTLAVLLLTASLLPAAAVAGDGPWFDLEKCDMCKHMSGEKGLMEHMEWENHLTKDGMMSVTVVAHGYEEAFGRAMANMEAAGGKMMAGEKMYLCGFCQSYGSLMMAGANFENFESAAGHINLVSSRDPAVIAKIHTHGQRTIDEYNKMVAVQGEGHEKGHGKGHDKHDH
jgi:hypothetical protein